VLFILSTVMRVRTCVSEHAPYDFSEGVEFCVVSIRPFVCLQNTSWYFALDFHAWLPFSLACKVGLVANSLIAVVAFQGVNSALSVCRYLIMDGPCCLLYMR